MRTVRSPRNAPAAAMLLALGALGASLVWADDTILKEVRPEYWVDGPGAAQLGVTRSRPDVEVDSQGRTIHVYEIAEAPGGDNLDIFVRRFEAGDTSPGDQQMVNTTTDSNQGYPRVAARADGAFFVVWQSLELDTADAATQSWVRGQFFGADGNPSGSEQLISELSAGAFPYEIGASVAALENGTFVVVWESKKGFGTDSQDCTGGAVGCGTYSIQAHRVGIDGVPVGSQFQVNVDPNSAQRDPSVAPTSNGGFFVVWYSHNSIGTDSSGESVQGRRFHANGSPDGGEFQVNTTTTGDQWLPEMAMNGLGQHLVVYVSPNLVNQGRYNIRGQLLDSDGTALGGDFFLTSAEPLSRQDFPRVAGGLDFFVAVWEVAEGVSSDADDTAVNGRIVTGPSEFEGEQFQVNVFETDFQEKPAVGGNRFDVVVSWRTRDHDFEISNADAIVGRGYRFCSFFCDDFESGDTDRWSSVTP